MFIRLSTSVFALSTALAAPAFADVSAADVFANQQALYGGMGATLSGQIANGELSAPQINAILPMGAGSLQLSTDAAVAMVENGDGTVTISYPSPMTVSVAGSIQGEGTFAASATMTHDGYTVIATGDPSDVSYAYDARNLKFEIGALTIDGVELDDVDISGFFKLSEWTGTSQVTVGNLVNYVTNSNIGASSLDFTVNAEGVESINTQTSEPMQSNVNASFPIGGSDLLNLSAAVRNGLSVAIESIGGGSQSFNETLLNGDLMNRQATSIGQQSALVTFDENGLMMSGDAAGFAMSVNEPMLFPGDLEFAAEALSMVYDIPLNASEDAQDFRLATSMTGITIGDTIWNLFDPAGLLPRDPAEVSFDITGLGTNGTDLLDVMAMSQMFGPPAIEVDEVTIENLRIAAAGAELMAKGAATFDWTDFQTIPGIARPEGQVTINLNGANKLMDTLAQMGLIPEEELMMPRMMMGMFSTPVGDDMLETVLEVNSEGHVLANGQRLQ